MTEPTNLRALLGDRYDAVIEKATLALYASSGCSDWPEVVDPERAYWLGDAAATLAAVLPDLLAEAWAERDALAAKVDRVRALHVAYYPFRPGRAYCGACEGDEFVPYPCPTIRALDGTTE